MKVSDFDYFLPEELIAQRCTDERDASRLFVVHPAHEEHRSFRDITDYFSAGDVLVINDTKVIPARVFGTKKTGAQIEFLFIRPVADGKWEAMIKPAKRVKAGDYVFCNGNPLLIHEKLSWGGVTVAFPDSLDISHFFSECGRMPVPPYIHNDDQEYLKDRYQTVYADNDGSVAAPTAGLHFTGDILNALKAKGVSIVPVTLHVGPGTFLPMKVEHVHEHRMHSEFFTISEPTAAIINSRKGKLFACGTTVIRTLEYMADEQGKVQSGSGWCDLFITPGYSFKCVHNCITNFHLPKSTLIMLVAARIGHERVLSLYAEAVQRRYRFFSFGDAMLILDF